MRRAGASREISMRRTDRSRSARPLRRLLAVLLPVLLIGAASAQSAQAAPKWRIDSLSATSVEPGGTMRFTVDARNVGDAPTDGSPIHWSVVLPPGATATSTFLLNPGLFGYPACTAEDGTNPGAVGENRFVCDNTGKVGVGAIQTLWLSIEAPTSSSDTILSSFSVEGGGGGSASTVDPTRVGPVPGFGVDLFENQVTADALGNPATQAAGHPAENTTYIDFNTVDRTHPLIDGPFPIEGPKDVFVAVPPGFVGNPTGATECSFSDLAHADGVNSSPNCAPSSQVGTTFIALRNGGGVSHYGPAPVFRVTPPPGVPARFGFSLVGTTVVLDAELRSDGDYGLTVAARDIPEGLAFTTYGVTFWGVPADPAMTQNAPAPE